METEKGKFDKIIDILFHQMLHRDMSYNHYFCKANC